MSYIKLEDDYEPPTFDFKRPTQREFEPIVKGSDIYDGNKSTPKENKSNPFEFDPFQNSDLFSSTSTSLENERFNVEDSSPNTNYESVHHDQIMSQSMAIPAYPSPLSTIECTISIKLCSFGFVASKKWYSVYLVIENFNVRIYESREAYHSSNAIEIMDIRVDKYTHTSPINPKSYKNIIFYTFYIQYDNGAFMPTKLLKIGCVTRPQAEMIKDGVRFYRNN